MASVAPVCRAAVRHAADRGGTLRVGDLITALHGQPPSEAILPPSLSSVEITFAPGRAAASAAGSTESGAAQADIVGEQQVRPGPMGSALRALQELAAVHNV